MRADNQRKKILAYMQNHGSITPFECAVCVGSFKLATRIGELINDGVRIASEWIEWTDEDGEKSRCKRYWLVTEDE